jgi:mono/diheme cytochrome c family protein
VTFGTVKIVASALRWSAHTRHRTADMSHRPSAVLLTLGLMAASCGGGAAAHSPATSAPVTATLPALSTPLVATLPPQTAAPTSAATPTTAATAASSATGSPASLVAAGKVVFTTVNGTGCQACHGVDGKGGIGTDGVTQAPNIRGATEQKLRDALRGGAALMTNIKLTDDQITAVLAYIAYLDLQ